VHERKINLFIKLNLFIKPTRDSRRAEIIAQAFARSHEQLDFHFGLVRPRSYVSLLVHCSSGRLKISCHEDVLADDHMKDREPPDFLAARRIVGLVVLLLIAWFLLRSLRGVVLLFAIVFVVAMVLNPIVGWLQLRGVPRVAGVIVLLIGLLAVTTMLAVVAGPPIISQLHDLGQRAPNVWHNIHARLDSSAKDYPALAGLVPTTDEIVTRISAQAGAISSLLLRSTITFVGGIFSLLLAILLLIFVLTDPQPLVSGYLVLIPDRHREPANRALERFMQQVRAWARGVLINGAISGVSTGVLLWLIGVQPAFLFAVLTFFGQLAPPIGPMILSLPPLLVALSIGPTTFFLTLAAILFVQQGVTTVVVPYVFGREMRLNPVVILFYTVAAASLMGLAGAVLAIPIAALVQIVIDEFYLRPRKLDYAKIDRDAAALVEGKSDLSAD